MHWPSLVDVLTNVQLPAGIQLEQLDSLDIPILVDKLKIWYPDIVVGAESGHLDPVFYENVYFLQNGDERKDSIALKIVYHEKLSGILTFSRDVRAQSLTSRLGVVDPELRGVGIANGGPLILELMARRMGAGLAYYFATLKHPFTQKSAERCGFKLVGIVPAFDRDMIQPAVVKRVYEAIYAKVLASDDEVFKPTAEALTPNTRAFFEYVFGPLES